VLAAGVMEGRRVFANTMKYVLMGTSSNFGNHFSAAAASAVLAPTFGPRSAGLPAAVAGRIRLIRSLSSTHPRRNGEP
jgi:hypothetical protein